MGAVTAILQAHRDHSIAGMVLDSPFSNLNKLSLELAKTYTKIPGFIAKLA
jgi:alpha-beta hydrolase superfamily lysophospholipase